MTTTPKKLKYLALTGTTALLGASLVACSPVTQGGGDEDAGDSVYDQVQALPDDTRMDELVKAAEEEGEVTVYLRSDVVFDEIKAAFEDKYDIELTIENPGLPTAVFQQIAEGSAAGQQRADVVETFSYELELNYPEENLVAPLPDFLKAEAPDQELVSDYSAEVWSYPFIPMWNTNTVTGGDVPTSVEDFTGDVWTDKTVMAKGDFLWAWYRGLFEQYTEEEGMSVDDFEAMMTTIAGNSDFADSSNPAAAGIASGEYNGGPNIALTAGQKLEGEPPISWEPTPDPAIAVPLGVSLISDAPHPNAGMLFTQWYLTEGADIVEEEQFMPQNENETDLEGVEIKRTDLSEMTPEEVEEWRVAYANLTSGKTPILPESVRGN